MIAILILIMIPLTIILAPLARAIARRIEYGPPAGAPAQLSIDVEARLERMEQAIDAIALEVERIAEGQRFTSRLLAGRDDDHRHESAPLASTPNEDSPAWTKTSSFQ